MVEPCLLCGHVHSLRIHANLWRKIRNSEYEVNDEVQIISIICKTAKKNGNPYTRRLLPEFIIPGCVIMLDRAFAAYKMRTVSQNIEDACSTMLCIDTRTAQKHLTRIETAIKLTSLRLAETIARQPELGDLPYSTPDFTLLEVLERLFETKAIASLRSGDRRQTQGILSHIQETKWGIFLNRPSTCVKTKLHPP